MKKINVVEILKNCPKGMELDCAMLENVVFDHIYDGIYPIRIKKKDGSLEMLTENGCFHLGKDAKCVIFPKGKTTWEGFVPPCKFKDGDILAAGDWVFIFKELHTNGSPRCYCHYDLTLEEFKVDTNSYMACGGDIYLATKEQQDLLFSKMEGAGYQWNAEKKCLEKLEKERFDISTLKPFDRVLVRDSDNGGWSCDLFSHYRGKDIFYAFCCVSSNCRCCIPFEGNEHLCGTSEDCAEFYKVWEE